jgi:oxygen-independent coproporphyrinogen-3 oxidase
MGVQSLDEALLDRLGRIHSREMVFKSFDVLRRAGFDNINLDLMFAIPGQSLAVWHSTLGEAIAMGSEHLSSYEVIYEEDTPLYEALQAGEFSVDEALACAMYDALIERASASGFVQYEIANFARNQPPVDRPGPGPASLLPAAPWDPAPAGIPGRACQHNINYWRGGAYHGLGPSAAGFVGGLRTRNVSNTARYCELLEQGTRPLEWKESLLPLSRAGEIAAVGLRMNVGWGFEEFQSVTGFDLRETWRGDMDGLVARGWGQLTPERFRLSPAGLRFADAAAEAFLK